MSTDVRFYLSYDIRITLKSHFWRKNVIILLLCTQRCYGRHNHAKEPLYPNSAVIAWWLQSTSVQNELIKILFINKGMELIDLNSILNDRSVTSSVPNNFNNTEIPIVCC